VQNTVNVIQEEIERGKLHGSSRSPIGRHLKSFGRPMLTVLPALMICLLVPTGRETSVAPMLSTVALAQSAAPQSDAQKAFKQLKTLAGNWEGPTTTVPQMPDMAGLVVHVSLRVTSGGAALMHEMVPKGRSDDPTSGADDPVTMFYLEGDGLLLTHYCDSWKNRPRMSGKLSPDGKTVEFEFLDVAGTKRGYMSHAVFTFIDANHHTEDWTTNFPGDKQGRAHLDLHRTK
jgi:hypothetical protein